MNLLSLLRSLFGSARAKEIDDELSVLESPGRRQLLRSLAVAAPLVVVPEAVIELLKPARTIILPPAAALEVVSAGQVWSVNTLGGYFYSRQLSNVLRSCVQPLTKFRQFVDVRALPRTERFTWDAYPPLSGRERVTLALEESRAARASSSFGLQQRRIRAPEECLL